MQTTIDLPKIIDPHYLKEALAAVLYYNGTLSEYEACQMIGTDRRDFEEAVLPKFNLSVIGGTPEDVEFERQACLRE